MYWNQAKRYSAHLGLGGYSNWRLPTIDELAAIYDPTQHADDIKGGIKLSGIGPARWVWSPFMPVGPASQIVVSKP